MKKLKKISLVIALVASLITYAHEVPADYKHIECTFEPVVRASHKSPNPKPIHIGEPYRSLQEATGSSTNWSGYVSVTNLTNPAVNSVSYVVGSWVVPTIKNTPQTKYSSIWVGIDGYSSGTVEQLGTEHDWNNGKQVNYAWFEMYPNYAYKINGFPVNIGDSMTASVQYIGTSTFKLSITNNTKKVTTTIPYSYTQSATAQRSSAEWIVEAPYLNGILPLANFGIISFSNCTTTINGVTGAINDNHWQFVDVVMVSEVDGQPKATPSILTNNGQNFSVTFNKSKSMPLRKATQAAVLCCAH